MIYKCKCFGRVKVGQFSPIPERNKIEYIPFKFSYEIDASSKKEAKLRAVELIHSGKIESMGVFIDEITK